MVKKDICLKLLLASIVLVFSQVSYAAISCNARSSPYTIPATTLTVQRDMPINSSIGAIIYSNNNSSVAFSCYYTISTTEYVNIGIETDLAFHSIIDNRAVYSTSIPGVGVAIGVAVSENSTSLSSTSAAFIRTGNSFYPIGYAGTAFNYKYFYTKTGIQFYKIGPTSSGVFYGNIARTKNSVSLTSVPVSLDTVRINSVACTINTPVIQVPLSDVNVNDFTAINKTLSPKGFSLGLNCDAGAKINVKMLGVKNTDTTADGVLQLTDADSQATATGVGIQILYNSKPLALDNNLVLKTSVGGQETFPFTAQYYQTKSKVTGGTANSTMILDVTYQ